MLQVSSMDRIIIELSSLSQENWLILYRFIKGIVSPDTSYNREVSFSELKSIASVSLTLGAQTDVAFKYGDDLRVDQLDGLKTDTCFSIIYHKIDGKEDFAELIPFVLIQHEFGRAVTIGVDLDRLEVSECESYKYKISDFFLFYYDLKPICGTRSLYLINEKKLDTATGRVFYTSSTRVSSLAGKSQLSQKGYSPDPSRRFLPFLPISKDNYPLLFASDEEKDTDEVIFVRKAIEQLSDTPSIRRFLRGNRSVLTHTDTLFGKWLLLAYLYSYDDESELDRMTDEQLTGIQQTMRFYENSIFELVQNIVFYGGERGIIYCAFDKKENISANYSNRIPNYVQYDKHIRFMRIGLFDFGENGIVDTYKGKSDSQESEADMTLRDFFDTESIATTDLTKLELRYAARLGIKTFVKTIISHGGYFRVESNETDGKHKTKRVLQTEVEEGVARLCVKDDIDFVDGTHYEVVLPVIPHKVEKSLPLQRSSIMCDWYMDSNKSKPVRRTVKTLDLPEIQFSEITKSLNKKEQIEKIVQCSNYIIEQGRKQFDDVMALDLNEKYVDPRLLFKVLSYIQLKDESGFKIIYIVNAQDSFIKEFGDLLLLIEEDETVDLWSRSSAVILINIYLHIQIIWGKKKDELDYVNKEIQKYYCNYFFDYDKSKDGKKDEPSQGITLGDSDKAFFKELIAPHDMMVYTDRRLTLFEEFIPRLLRRKVISDDLGCLVNHQYTYIGSKIIVKNYYEADMLFQNNFFIERFAYIVADSIKKNLDEVRKVTLKKRLILIGYQQYSEYLLKSVKKALPDEDVSLVICHEDRELSNRYFFNFKVDGPDTGTEERLLAGCSEYQFLTIVPIGATLSTNDKIIALFKQWFEAEVQKIRRGQGKESETDGFALIKDEQFVYNHCVIIVRDSTSTPITDLEREQKWEAISLEDRLIRTNFKNAHVINYSIQVASDDDPHNWVRRLNKEVSFPQNWWEESYVNYTENASINSQNLMGYPECETGSESDHMLGLNRLFEFRNDILKGHIVASGGHYRYYADTESFVKRRDTGLRTWLEEINIPSKEIFNQDKLNILVTPNLNQESDFVKMVNDCLFKGAAMIVCLDVRNWRGNVVHKLSYLRDISSDNVRYHYVDHALLTGDTYNSTKSYLFSVLQHREKQFSSIITIVNRLSFARYKELSDDVKQSLFAYVNLYYPGNHSGQRCELCELSDYYDNLRKRTVLDSCINVINNNQRRLEQKNLNFHHSDVHPRDRRAFLRMVMTHELYYRIAEVVKTAREKKVDFKEESRLVEERLDSIYLRMKCCDVSQSRSEEASLSRMIDEWNNVDLFPDGTKLKEIYVKRLSRDKMISFLKVISSPPLSRYISIRKYAYGKLLTELHDVLNKPKDQCELADLITVKAILKSLSLLKSNALVRKDVIVGAWLLLSNVVDNLNVERENLLRNLGMIQNWSNVSFSRWMALKGKRLSEGTLFSEIDEKIERYSFEKYKQAVSVLREELVTARFKSTSQSAIIQDFSRDFQFFVKNAIIDEDSKATFLGELLRKGQEFSDFGFDSLKICPTSLYLEKKSGDRQIVPETSCESESRNELFMLQFNTDNQEVKNEYIHFLVWLFYDNTTILRKTLDNFARELDKDFRCRSFFYDTDDSSPREESLKAIEEFKNSIDDIKDIFRDKITEEYYYNSFIPYLKTGDDVDYVTKLLYVIYAKLKLDDLSSKHHKTEIERDTYDLMCAFSAIMGADAAFWTMSKPVIRNAAQQQNPGKERRMYPISIYGQRGGTDIISWNYSKWKLNKDYYTWKLHKSVLNDSLKTPIIPKYHLNDDNGEKRDLKANSLGVFVIDSKTHHDNIKDTHANLEEGVLTSISFLYGTKNKIVSNERTFRVNLQESGRLILLLKNDLYKYVTEYLIKDRAYDLWEGKHLNDRRFKKVYSESSHRFHLVYEEMDAFEKMQTSVIKALYQTWFCLSNETISTLYSSIENNINGKDGSHFLNMLEEYVIDKNNTIGRTFNVKFKAILLGFLDSTNQGFGEDKLKNQIFINGSPLKSFYLEPELKNTPIRCNKHILRTLIAQCLHNSLSCYHNGHRSGDEAKEVNISITKEYILIADHAYRGYNSKEIKERKDPFNAKKKSIKKMDCESFSSTTLTSLQGVVNYMRSKRERLGGEYYCDFDFNDDGNFYVKLNFAHYE